MDTYELWMRKRLGWPLKGDFDPSNYEQDKAKLLLNFGKHRRSRLDVIACNDPGYLKWAFKNAREKLPSGVVDFIRDNRDQLQEDIEEEQELDRWE